jgi:hypothetical protein
MRKKHDHVHARERPLEPVIDLHAQRLDARGHQGARSAEPHLRAEQPQERRVRARPREWVMSPQIATLRASSRPKAWRIANASSSACVGCSCAPSPPLTTLQPIGPVTVAAGRGTVQGGPGAVEW